jgi:hypothetical protein
MGRKTVAVVAADPARHLSLPGGSTTATGSARTGAGPVEASWTAAMTV